MTEQREGLTRREFLKKAGKAVVGFLAIPGIAEFLIACAENKEPVLIWEGELVIPTNVNLRPQPAIIAEDEPGGWIRRSKKDIILKNPIIVKGGSTAEAITAAWKIPVKKEFILAVDSYNDELWVKVPNEGKIFYAAFLLAEDKSGKGLAWATVVKEKAGDLVYKKEDGTTLPLGTVSYAK